MEDLQGFGSRTKLFSFNETENSCSESENTFLGMNPPSFLSKVRVEEFKGLKNLEVDLGRITVLSGRNGCGKSSFLESIRFLFGVEADSPFEEKVEIINSLKDYPLRDEREEEEERVLAKVEAFSGRELVSLLEIKRKREKFHGKTSYYFRKVIPDQVPKFSVAFYSGRHLKSFSERLEVIDEKEVLDLVRKINPNVVSVASDYGIGMGKVEILSGNSKRVVSPILLGSGFANLLDLAFTIFDTSSNLVLADDIENNLHYSVIPQLVEKIVEVSRDFGKQFIVSTNSRDVLSCFSELSQCDFLKIVDLSAVHRS